MAFRDFSKDTISRRAMLRGGAILAAGGAVAGLPLGGAALAQGSAKARLAWPNVTARIEDYVGRRRVANMMVTFGWGQEAPRAIARGNIAFASQVPAGLDTLYRVYSMTKPITGMATMMLIDDGRIGLDQPLGEILPAFAEMQVLTRPDGPLTDTVPAARPITIRHLLTHTAGLGYDIVNKGPLLEAYRAAGISSGQLSRMPIPGLPAIESAPGLEEWANRLARLPLIAQPGTKWSYSASIDLLGRVIEVASGKRFDTFLQERLFDPCGMDSTYFQVPRSEIARLADNYGIVAGMPLPVDPARASIFLDAPPVLWGGSGLVMSARDYDRFQRMLLGYGAIDGRRVMGELAVRVGTSNLLPKGVDTTGSWIAGQGFGAGGRVVGQTFGWGGAAGTLASVDFGLKLRTALFTQYMPAEAYPVRDEFLRALELDLAQLKGG